MSADNTALANQNDTLFDQNHLQGIVSQLLDEAKRQGATSAEAGLSIETGLSVTVRLGEVETVEHNRDKGLGITVYIGQQKGTASTTDFSARAISETVKAACDIARYTQPDQYAGLPDKTRLATSIEDLDLYHKWNINTTEAISIATECEQVARDYDKRIINSEGAYVTSHKYMRVYGNTHGFIGNYLTSRHSLGCTVIAEDEKGMQRDYWYTLNRIPEKLQDASQVGSLAAQRTLRRLDARKIKTQRVPVIFQAETARGLLGHLVRAISGGAQYRKASFLLDAEGSQIFPEHIKIDERPHLKAALGSVPFDNEGVATCDRELVSQGVLQGYVLDSYAARRLGRETTGNAGGVHNLFINSSDMDLTTLVKKMGKGVLVTEVMGQGVNIVTGDYSRGAAGFWVENGEIQYPIDEFTIASNLSDMFKNLTAVGNDIDDRTSLQTGSWFIEEMMIAGQ